MNVHVYMRVHMYVCILVCMLVCMYERVCVYGYVPLLYYSSVGGELFLNLPIVKPILTFFQVKITIRCIDGLRELTFKSAKSCGCSVCRKD